MKNGKLTRNLQNLSFAILIIFIAFAAVSCDNDFIIKILPIRDQVTAEVPQGAEDPVIPNQPQHITYTIVIDIIDDESGDTVTASPDSGIEGDIVTLAYTVADTAHYNLLDFGGVTSPIASVESAGSGERTYVINAADASDGVITITAIFEHTNLVIDSIAFSDTEGHIIKTYGDAAFTNAITAEHSGSGAITYYSENPIVATVSSSGQVTIHKVGSTVITAEKAADAVYAHAQKDYTLAVAPKPVTITGLSAGNKVYDGTTTTTVSGTAVISELVGDDNVTAVEGTAVFEDASAGTSKAVIFNGWSLTGEDAGNYSLSAQPSLTANITAKPVSITGLSVANKVCDGTTTATVTGTAIISGKIATDTVTVSAGTATFASSTVGNGKTVVFSDWSLTGADAGNYTLSAQPSLTANIISMIEVVPIPAGTFTMGSPATEPDSYSGERPQHSVTLSGFNMGKYQVTQSQYQAVMGAGEDRTTTTYGKGDNYPIYYVNWYDAIVFCNKLSMMEGLDPVYSIGGSTDPAVWIANNSGSIPTSNNSTWNGAVMDRSKNGYRLPTEAEWEYACRAGTTTPFNTGNNITTDQANYNGNYPYNGNATGIYRGKTTPVGSFAPNAYGLYDMHGNLWEWCWDWYGDYSSGAQTNPTGAATGTNRVLRGGSWNDYGRYLRSAYRFLINPGIRDGNIGFRLVCP